MTPAHLSVMMSDYMAAQSTLTLLDQALDGRLSEYLRTRTATRSAGQLTHDIATEFGVTVNERTVRRWLAELEEPEPEAACQ